MELLWVYNAKGKSTMYVKKKFRIFGFTLIRMNKRYRNFNKGEGWIDIARGKKVSQKTQKQLDFLLRSRSTPKI